VLQVVALEEVANECYKISVEMGREQTVAAVLDGRGSHFIVKVNDQVSVKVNDPVRALNTDAFSHLPPSPVDSIQFIYYFLFFNVISKLFAEGILELICLSFFVQ
jgi:hypothetical protein